VRWRLALTSIGVPGPSLGNPQVAELLSKETCLLLQDLLLRLPKNKAKKFIYLFIYRILVFFEK
jgi:hypothetical protein